jgi:hypothetical protein
MSVITTVAATAHKSGSLTVVDTKIGGRKEEFAGLSLDAALRCAARAERAYKRGFELGATDCLWSKRGANDSRRGVVLPSVRHD